MKTIKRWIGNLKWLFNHPPTTMTVTKNPKPCIFCGERNSGIVLGLDELVCWDCMLIALKKIMENKKRGTSQAPQDRR